MKVLNLVASTNDAGDKTLHLNIFGVIAQGWADTVDAAEIAKSLSENRDAKEIIQHINSIGGDMFDGIAIHNLVKGHGAPVTSIVEGMAASAASIIAMTGKTVMGSGSMMMIHNPWTIAMGDAKELRRVAADLDKSRESLIAIYKAKTGKEGTELRALLDAETLMTAEQAKRNGFADEIATDAPATVEAKGEFLMFNQVAFPRDRLPSGVLNMAQPTPPAPVISPPPAPPEQPITRESVSAKAPDLLTAILEEGHKAGVAAERARLKEIDDLDLPGAAEMVKAAKYGEKPLDARDLTYAVAKAGKLAASDLLAARERESKEAAAVKQSPPAAKNEEAALIESMKAHAKAMAARREGRK